jgi:hypothetical protein
MTLDENQKQTVAGWIEEGLKLAEIQSRMDSDMGIKLTYMEVRLLVDDLKLVPKDPDPPKEPDAPAAAPDEILPPDKGTPAPPPAADPLGKPAGQGVSVSVDSLTKPGSLVSGNVTFSDGNTAEWYLDQMGRLGLVPKTEGYRPSQADVQEFQAALEREIQRAGL